MVTQLADQTSFETAINNQNLSVVHFEVNWAEQCVQTNELLEGLVAQKDYAKVKFYTCPAEDLPEVSHKYKITGAPTLLFFRSGRVLESITGIHPAKIIEIIRKYMSSVGDNEGSLEDRLKNLINKSKVMLFMKGDRHTPRCGFSRQIIEILNNTGIPYETFDILSDEEVRQGLKAYSDWPTYPQLYVKGDLIGGLDIVKEMLASGELESTLND